MSEIRARVKLKMWEIIDNCAGNPAVDVVGLLLSIPNLKVVDLEAELPKSRIIYDRDGASGERIIRWQRKNWVVTGDEAKTALEAIGEAQQDMLKEGWVKEVKDETNK